MLHTFFQKHIESFDSKDAIKLIEKKIDLAKDYCVEHNPKYLEELAKAYTMIQDYFASKNILIESVLK